MGEVTKGTRFGGREREEPISDWYGWTWNARGMGDERMECTGA